MDNKRIYVDIHALQIVPPSCINRDDTGAPKTCIYGGTMRSRVSSQSWKRSIREEFKELYPDETGIRTKKIVGMVKDEILLQDPAFTEEKAAKAAQTALTNAGLKIKDAEKGTDALMFMSKKQASALAELVVKGEKDKKEYKKALAGNPSIDMALFGRMVASDPSLNYDAACQVSHAISTHETPTEFDYFTAVDDLSEDTSGAGHIGITEFNSSTLYRYATINVMELYRSLGMKAPEAVGAFVKAFIKSMPSGKINSFANGTLPSSVYITVRDDQPVTLVGAFEKAIPASSEGYLERSEDRLIQHANKLTSSFVKEPYKSFVIGDGLEGLAKPVRIEEAVENLEEEIKNLLENGGC
ncbi:type I-E CRISPR-associated protein Cas7/Cse4/CasC [Ileibacterium valens]|uniref:Type I-E CRISPR-associated protein Cas7/Cse4/CasC n=1 Tax=Ileibacterium valens TaxID=1862668 RepID=A0A1U7NE51_9FIRM|nr:type I-E CRISPR-associated protein Cas7/Cse4/CasC [Ileibacterium valens]OLU36589.1 type I-E CRISPR-associated protein Cas7/Cse4/CasC [Erysipelotrichaceae bacterium NYU-BL-E8]OLU37794.1 type I-E CRISPR-associated protein Cas7/Cse4/CasC [Ileibacterium valens]OLU41841.1 type I-E CRISPR-associated protein Cas7/Cse4/CasC [Erysipelotrichaceae bacterium NYU-BL-F16]